MAAGAASGDAVVVKAVLDDAIALHRSVRDGDHGAVIAAAAAIRGSFASGGKLLIFGNGGSAGDAQHFATELVVRFERERAALPALALSADTSVVTAAANDYGFDRVFARQIEALGRPGDVAFGISTSGGSANVLRGIEAANARGLRTIALTGRDGGAVGPAAAVHINVPGDSTARVQEVHRTLLHVLCTLLERTWLEAGSGKPGAGS